MKIYCAKIKKERNMYNDFWKEFQINLILVH